MLDAPVLDGVASVIIGLILAGVAVILARETRGLLVGESADPELAAGVRAIAVADAAVDEVIRMLTMHVGPEQVLVNLDLRFRSELDAAAIEDSVHRLERAIKGAYPSVRYLFMETAALTDRNQ